eukprot:2668105-Prymnesium_polylepis.1
MPSSSSGHCLLPLGDDVTQSDASLHSWRYHLWKDLVDANASDVFDWAGSLSTNRHCGPGCPQGIGPNCDCPDSLWPDYKGISFPRLHEGRSTFTTWELMAGIKAWLGSYTCWPTCVLLHMGNNDVCQPWSQTADRTVANIRAIVRELQSNAAVDTRVLLAVPIPTCCGAVSDNLAPLIRPLANASANVFVVDQADGFDVATMSDGCRPNALGERAIAR